MNDHPLGCFIFKQAKFYLESGTTGLEEKLPRCKAQTKLEPERTIVREDCSFAQQRRRWVTFHPNIIETASRQISAHQ